MPPPIVPSQPGPFVTSDLKISKVNQTESPAKVKASYEALKTLVNSASFKNLYIGTPKEQSQAREILNQFINSHLEIRKYIDENRAIINSFKNSDQISPEDKLFAYFIEKNLFVHIGKLNEKRGAVFCEKVKPGNLISSNDLFSLKNIFKQEKIPSQASYILIETKEMSEVGFTMGPQYMFGNNARTDRFLNNMNAVSSGIDKPWWPKIPKDQAISSVALHEFTHANILDGQLKIQRTGREYNWAQFNSKTADFKISNAGHVDEFIAFTVSFNININTIIPELLDNHVEMMNPANKDESYAFTTHFLNQKLTEVFNRNGLDGKKIMSDFSRDQAKAENEYQIEFDKVDRSSMAPNQKSIMFKQLDKTVTEQKFKSVQNLLGNFKSPEDIKFIQNEFFAMSQSLLVELRRVNAMDP